MLIVHLPWNIVHNTRTLSESHYYITSSNKNVTRSPVRPSVTQSEETERRKRKTNRNSNPGTQIWFWSERRIAQELLLRRSLFCSGVSAAQELLWILTSKPYQRRHYCAQWFLSLSSFFSFFERSNWVLLLIWRWMWIWIRTWIRFRPGFGFGFWFGFTALVTSLLTKAGELIRPLD